MNDLDAHQEMGATKAARERKIVDVEVGIVAPTFQSASVVLRMGYDAHQKVGSSIKHQASTIASTTAHHASAMPLGLYPPPPRARSLPPQWRSASLQSLEVARR